VFVTQSAAKTKKNLGGMKWPKILDGIREIVDGVDCNLRRRGRLRFEKKLFTMGEWPDAGRSS
jgi:hypothetical protein